ncbi:MAG: hypothetical protein J6K22_03575 [Spirochaetaceae bacterium]|nr:hypothetical protein [Spirochaetaceae bacterium]
MKTKTDYFTKFITFCVLSLFLITNMILFTSCDNGNSPNDNTNEEQNNNAPTDYCKICDGVQDKDHQHDYCDTCDDIQTDPNHTCPPATDICDICEGTQTDASHYFHVETIGGEGSAYKVAYPNWNDYRSTFTGEVDPLKMMQDFQDNYENYINSLEFSDKFKAYCTDKGYQTPADIDFKTFDEYTSGLSTETTSYKNNFDYLIGSTTDDYNKSINDICKPIFEDITQNIIATSDNPALDKDSLWVCYRAFKLEDYKKAYKDFENSSGYNTFGKDYYDTEKQQIIDGWNWIYSTDSNYGATSPFNIYISENGTEKLNPEAIQHINSMLTKAASRMNVNVNDLQNMINFSFVMDSLDAVHDYTSIGQSSSITQHNCNTYPTNEMLDIIDNTEITK